jgi:hypothetical protein
MRRIIAALGILCCIAGFSCSKICCDVPIPVDSMKATRNGSAWEIDNTVGRLQQDSLIVTDTSVNPQHTELIAFKLKFKGADTYTLDSSNVIYAYVPQMDNPYAYYTLDPGYANTFRITDYDVGGGFVYGTFNIKVNKDPSNSDPRYPATVSFLSGSFSVHLSK